MSEAETARFIDVYLYHNQLPPTGIAAWQGVAHHVVKVLFCVQIPFVLWRGFRRINSYDHLLEHYLSSPEDKQLTWVKLMLVIFTGTSAVSILSGVLGRHRFAGDEVLLAIPSLVYTLLLFAIGYIGLKQQGIEELLPAEQGSGGDSQLAVPAAEASAGFAETAIVADAEWASMPLGQRIEQLVRGRQLFLDPSLKLTDLVQQLNTNRNYVYRAINVDMQMSFSEYINRMRVEYATSLIKAHPELSVAEVTARSGFSSTVSFYRNFKAYKGSSLRDFKAKADSAQGCSKSNA